MLTVSAAGNYDITFTFNEETKAVGATAETAAVELTKSTLAIITSVEYTTDEVGYTTKWASLSNEQVAAICNELGFESLDEATVYGYNPTTGELVSDYYPFDGWRGADGDFHTWTGNAEAPFCIKYSDGQNYECYNIGGMEPQTYKGYYAIANDTKYVLVEISFIYSAPPRIELDLTGVVVEGSVSYNVTDGDYTAKSFVMSDGQVKSILDAIGLDTFEDERCEAYIYDPATNEFATESFDGWRDANGLGAFWTGRTDVPICVKFQYYEEIVCFNLFGIEPQTITTYYAIANNDTKKAALIKVNFTYEGKFPTYTVAGGFGEKYTNDADEIFGEAWDISATAHEMAHTDRTLWTLHFEDVGLTAGTIFYRVVADHSWKDCWGFGSVDASYEVDMPDGLSEAFFDITFFFSPLGLSNGYNLDCEVVYDENAATGINNIATDKKPTEGIYNLAGQRLSQPQKGLNIISGRKVVIK